LKKEITNLGKDSIIYGFGSVVNRFIGLITLPIFTNYLSTLEYGVLGILGLLALIAHPIFSLGQSAAMGPSYFQVDSLENKSKVVWSVFFISLISTAFLLFFAWVLPDLIGMAFNIPLNYEYLISISLTGTGVTILVTSFSQYVQFERQAKLYVFITIATALIAIITSFYAVVYLKLGIEGMVYGQLAGNVTSFLAFLIVGLLQTIPKVSTKIIKETLSLGVPLIPSFAFLFIIMHANKFVLEFCCGLEKVGIYSIGFTLGSSIGILTTGIAVAWHPFFMSYLNKESESVLIFGRILTYYFYIVGLVVLAYFIFSKPLIQILTHESFFEAYKVIGIISLAYFIQMIFNFFLPKIYYKREVKYVTLIQEIGRAHV